MAVRHSLVLLPGSNAKFAIARILRDEGFIEDFEILRHGPRRNLRIHLKYRDKKESAITGLKRVSKPSLRVYVGKGEIPRIYGGMGITVISTSQGVMTGREARQKGIGGEFLCYLW